MKIYLAKPDLIMLSNEISFGIMKELGFILTSVCSESDVIIAHNYKKLLPYVLRYPSKKFLVWTNEPRYDTSFRNQITLPLWFPKIKIMNVYSKDVFWNNLHFLASYHFDYFNSLGVDIHSELPQITLEQFEAFNKRNKIAALFTNTLEQRTKLMKGGINIDLSRQRCEIALAGHLRQQLDIYGNKWPAGYALDNSGYGFEKQRPWWIEKIEILKCYKFNLCLENTAEPYYVTEKIWHAIRAYSLPIYSSFNSSIYETFPENSFIDAAKFKNTNELLDYVKNMSTSEYLERMNRCIDVFNKSLVVKRTDYEQNTRIMVKKIIDRILE